MPKRVNKVILVGNVGKDPEVKYSQSGTPVANFSLATNERFKDRNDEWQDRIECTASWHGCVWRKSLGSTLPKAPNSTSRKRFRPRAWISKAGEEMSH